MFQDTEGLLKMELQDLLGKLRCSKDYVFWDKLMKEQPTGSILKQLTEEVWRMKQQEFLNAVNLDVYKTLKKLDSHYNSDYDSDDSSFQ